MNAPLRILIVAVLCVAALIGLVVRESRARADGTEVFLAIEAVDPRSLLSGHYVTLNPQTVLGPEACTALGEPSPDKPWLALGEVRVATPAATPAPFAAVGQYATRAEAARGGRIAVRGAATCWTSADADGASTAAVVQTRLDGVERFYINQQDAERIDLALREQRPGTPPQAFVIVSIGRDGRARLLGLHLNGERFDLSWR